MDSFPWMLLILLSVASIHCQGEDDNTDLFGEKISNYRILDDPFRRQKLNLLWTKARKQLTEGKLEKLYSELKIQDKEEMTLKRLKTENSDKDGMIEANLRKKFGAILKRYGLESYHPDVVPKDEGVTVNKGMGYFKDKKLNRLWEKAEKAGLSEDELLTLKQEFKHHQEKVEQYHDLLEMREELGADFNQRKNHIQLNDEDEEKKHQRHDNEVINNARSIKEDYHRLHRLATNTHPKEFEEEKVQALWSLAMEADFSKDELESIRNELHHFEVRIQKLDFLERELKMVDERQGGHLQEDREKTEGRKIMDKKLKKHLETVDQLQQNLEMKIVARHSEL